MGFTTLTRIQKSFGCLEYDVLQRQVKQITAGTNHIKDGFHCTHLHLWGFPSTTAGTDCNNNNGFHCTHLDLWGFLPQKD